MDDTNKIEKIDETDKTKETDNIDKVDVVDEKEADGETERENIIAKLDADEVYANIKKETETEWADKSDMIEFTNSLETESYHTLANLRIANSEIEDILNRVYEYWGTDYKMVLYEYEE